MQQDWGKPGDSLGSFHLGILGSMSKYGFKSVSPTYTSILLHKISEIYVGGGGMGTRGLHKEHMSICCFSLWFHRTQFSIMSHLRSPRWKHSTCPCKSGRILGISPSVEWLIYLNVCLPNSLWSTWFNSRQKKTLGLFVLNVNHWFYSLDIIDYPSFIS